MKKNSHSERIKNESAWKVIEVLSLLTGQNYSGCSAEDMFRDTERRKGCLIDTNAGNVIRDHSSIVKKIRRAVENGDIKTMHPLTTNDTSLWVLDKVSVLSWIESNIKTLSPLRHFPADTKDDLKDILPGKGKEPAAKRQTVKKNKRHAESNKHKKEIRKIAKELWKTDKTITITKIIFHDKINKIKKSDGSNYAEGTLRKWIKDLSPSNKPGRPKKN